MGNNLKYIAEVKVVPKLKRNTVWYAYTNDNNIKKYNRPIDESVVVFPNEIQVFDTIEDASKNLHNLVNNVMSIDEVKEETLINFQARVTTTLN